MDDVMVVDCMRLLIVRVEESSPFFLFSEPSFSFFLFLHF